MYDDYMSQQGYFGTPMPYMDAAQPVGDMMCANPYGMYNAVPFGAGAYNVPYGSMYGNIGMIKYTRAQYLEGLRNYVINNTGVVITKEEKLDDAMPQLLRHACAQAKISNLGICYFNVPETGVSIPFFFCTACGKLFYPRDFI